MSISIRNLIKDWPGPRGEERRIVDLRDFSAKAGDQVCLVGQSGSGKTTLLNMMAGIVRPTSGSICVGEVEITSISEARRDRFRAANIGYVFQTFNLLQSLSAMENILLAARFAGTSASVARERTSLLLNRLSLGHLKEAKPGSMSVGEQQRVAIARALVNRPQLLLADEPTANLDLKNGHEVIELLKDVAREEGHLLILVTHDREVIEHFDDVRSLSELSA